MHLTLVKLALVQVTLVLVLVLVMVMVLVLVRVAKKFSAPNGRAACGSTGIASASPFSCLYLLMRKTHKKHYCTLAVQGLFVFVSVSD